VSEEIDAALLWSTPRLRPAELERLRELLHSRLDWTAVLGILAVHRTMGVAWHNVLAHFIEERGQLTASYVFKGIEVMYKGQALMARDQIRYSRELMDALAAAGIRSALLKGAAVAGLAYPGLGMRVFNDNDILIDRDRLTDAGAVLADLGYVQGSWDYAKAQVRPARRADVMLYPVSSHQTHPYQRPTPAAATLECHRVDLHFSLDLLTPNRTDAAVADLLDHRVLLPDPPLWTLDPVDATVFVAVHFAKEAGYYGEVVRVKDLVLYKLVDLLALLSGSAHPVDPAALAARAVGLGLAEPVYHALHHADVLFPDRVPAGLLAALRPASLDYLDEVVDDAGTVHRWSVPIADRFFDARRLAKLAPAVPA
jgi:Uncharacterised nucleotidyltransferase